MSDSENSQSTRLGDWFAEVYEHGLWLSDESKSGPGSERASGQVQHAIKLLTEFTAEFNLRSIADLPCGDFNWMPAFLEHHPQVDYVGYDVVPKLISDNCQKFPNVKFQLLDITQQVPAKADILFSKDLLNHLSDDDVWSAISNMINSGADYILLTTNRGFVNEEIYPGLPHASRFLNLEAAPFFMPEPLYGDHYMLLWKGEVLKAWLETDPRSVGRATD